MARILLVDPSETARRAMKGILARGDHRFVAVDNPADAWRFIRHNPGIDLLFTGLQLEGTGNGLELVQKLRGDRFLKHLPVVVYTGHGDRNSVRLAVNLQVQNFLVKPYHDFEIFAEIEKTEVAPWRDQFVENEKTLCPALGLTPEALRQSRIELYHALTDARTPLQRGAELADFRPVADVVVPLREQAEAAGAHGVVEVLNLISTHAGENKWTSWEADIESLDYATLLLASAIDRKCGASPDFYSRGEIANATASRERARWLAAPAAGRCPMVQWSDLLRAVESLRGCPVIDSAAAGFQMIANGHPSCINPLMDLVARDPGLSAQMLIAANKAHPPATEDVGRIEDARLAVGQLGEIRLEAEAKNLVITEESVMDLPPHFDWPRYWTFQRGVARISQVICRDLEFYSLEPAARVAGQLHDIGKLILAHLQPAGFQAVLEHTQRAGISLRESERLFLGGTTADLAGHFAEHLGLSARFARVMRWIDEPTQAPEDRVLVAIVSLARELCRQNEVGTSGDPQRGDPVPLEATPEWEILREGLYPSFDLKKFETQVQGYCHQLRTEFSGHQSGTIAELAAGAVKSA